MYCGCWNLRSNTKYMVSSNLIQSMVTSQPNFIRNGGKAETLYKVSRKFGKVVEGIDCTSADGLIRKVYIFNYNQAVDLRG